ncbi:PKD domain-containing protein [Belliella sp. DSM 111904]|uniref:PKD domain-containing protein n=1 Tax=Belliella filtrata TaxID=2923435 RepID=A0ABS9V2S0_9BACT|nr:PKD domain-containing protein [Belliella filtrata]MCH7410711.1 PKD domain-containing protein [Belliella filtrata]
MRNFKIKLFNSKLEKIIFFSFILLIFYSSVVHGQRVLILKDQTNIHVGVTALKSHLESNGMIVDFSDFLEHQFSGGTFNVNGGIPKTLNDYEVVVHMNGETYGTPMPSAGQTALMDFVNSGGGYLGGEWLSFERSSHTIMHDLILLERLSGVTQILTFNKVSNLSHPITDNLPSNFSTSSAYGRSPGRIPANLISEVTVLMTSPFNSGDSPSVVFRELERGRVVFFDHTVGVYGSSNPYINDPNMLELYLSSINWLSGGIDVSGNLCEENNSVDFRVVYNDSQDPVISYSWTISDGTTSISNSILNKSFSSSGDYVVTVTLGLESGEIKTYSRNFKISPSASTAFAGDDVFLQPGSTSTSLIGNSPASGVPSWSIVSGPNTPNLSQSDAVLNLTGLINGHYVFKYTITAEGICDPKFDFVNLYIADVPRMNNLSVSNVTSSSATFNVDITSDAGSTITSRGSNSEHKFSS